MPARLRDSTLVLRGLGRRRAKAKGEGRRAKAKGEGEGQRAKGEGLVILALVDSCGVETWTRRAWHGN